MTFDILRARRLFLMLLGLVYAAAFASLFVQLPGLVGPNGILPVGSMLEAVKRHAAAGDFSTPAWHVWPSLCWLNSGEVWLQIQAAVGVALGLLITLGIAPILALPAAWLLYLSLMTAGQDFLSFQWDTLLLETGWLAIWLAPGGLRPRRATEHSPTLVVQWAFFLLYFRFVFASGLVKLQSGDPVWRDFTALTYHYYTQPLPTAVGWLVHQLPRTFHTLSCQAMFVIELFLPWLVFFGWRGRRLTAALTIDLMLTIFVTGNYGFFEPLTIALCLFLFGRPVKAKTAASTVPARRTVTTDFGRPLNVTGSSSKRLPSDPPPPPLSFLAHLGRSLSSAIALATALIGLLYFTIQVSERPLGPEPLRKLEEKTLEQVGDPFARVDAWIEPLHIVNRYGLFADMTTDRPEIVIEGSDDQSVWKPYEFRWKPGDLARTPGWCQPHMPRLDWQMWFAALSRHPPTWFQLFLKKLLDGEPKVLALLDQNPFPDHPPRFVRAVLYDYKFTTLDEHEKTNHWWKREERAIYFPPVAK